LLLSISASRCPGELTLGHDNDGRGEMRMCTKEGEPLEAPIDFKEEAGELGR